MKPVIASAAAFAAAILASPALAQAVVEEPGYCAQFYPNANCQNYGPGHPVTDPGGYWRNAWQDGPPPVVTYRRPYYHHHRHYR